MLLSGRRDKLGGLKGFKIGNMLAGFQMLWIILCKKELSKTYVNVWIANGPKYIM